VKIGRPLLNEWHRSLDVVECGFSEWGTVNNKLCSNKPSHDMQMKGNPAWNCKIKCKQKSAQKFAIQCLGDVICALNVVKNALSSFVDSHFHLMLVIACK
jgi:hypothetical protein